MIISEIIIPIPVCHSLQMSVSEENSGLGPAAAYSAAVSAWLQQVYQAQMVQYGNVDRDDTLRSTLCLDRLPQLSCISSHERQAV